MKILKQIIAELKESNFENTNQLHDLVLRYICYAPKMPLRILQEDLLGRAENTSLVVDDKYFSGKQLTFKAFRWGKGSRKILLTHGWGSKAADFNELIIALEQVDDMEIIAFDAPGNGASEGELSNLLLFIEAVKSMVAHFGVPNIVLGHSLGAMANLMAIEELKIHPNKMISIAPLINLGKNFEASMDVLNIPKEIQLAFFEQFEERFEKSISDYNLLHRSELSADLTKHWIAYDKNDLISPYLSTKAFLELNSSVNSTNYLDAGHQRMIKSPIIISDILEFIK